MRSISAPLAASQGDVFVAANTRRPGAGSGRLRPLAMYVVPQRDSEYLSTRGRSGGEVEYLADMFASLGADTAGRPEPVPPLPHGRLLLEQAHVPSPASTRSAPSLAMLSDSLPSTQVNTPNTPHLDQFDDADEVDLGDDVAPPLPTFAQAPAAPRLKTLEQLWGPVFPARAETFSRPITAPDSGLNALPRSGTLDRLSVVSQYSQSSYNSSEATFDSSEGGQGVVQEALRVRMPAQQVSAAQVYALMGPPQNTGHALEHEVNARRGEQG